MQSDKKTPGDSEEITTPPRKKLLDVQDLRTWFDIEKQKAAAVM